MTGPDPLTDAPTPAPAAGPTRAARAGSPGLVAAVVLGLFLIVQGLSGGAPPQPTSAQALVAHPDWADDPPADPLPASVPLRIRIPAIGVNAPLTGLTLDDHRHLVPPPEGQPDLAGWYSGGVAPGSAGAAIIAGHVDNAHGPAVFYGLGSLHRGDTVGILRRDHRTANFRIDGIDVFARSSFPDKRVYGPTGYPELRLITCGGGYSRATGYLGNVVVFAHLVAGPPS